MAVRSTPEESAGAAAVRKRLLALQDDGGDVLAPLTRMRSRDSTSDPSVVADVAASLGDATAARGWIPTAALFMQIAAMIDLESPAFPALAGLYAFRAGYQPTAEVWLSQAVQRARPARSTPPYMLANWLLASVLEARDQKQASRIRLLANRAARRNNIAISTFLAGNPALEEVAERLR